MILKRLYTDRRVIGVRVLRAKRLQHFSPGLIDGGLAEGWLSIGQGVITIAGEAGPVAYRIVRAPGAYCCHCDAPVGGPERQSPGNDGLTEGQRHARDTHGDTPSPDPLNPAGYRIEAHFTGVLIGDEVETLTREEAAKFDQQVRETLAAKLRAKYGDTRDNAERRRAAKAAAGEG
jgi:hypothetical protein